MTRFLSRPIDSGFYERVSRSQAEVRERRVLGPAGTAVDLDAGSLLSLELLDPAEGVDLFAFNRHDPYERIWHQSLISEGVFLTPFARLWGTLPRYRPLLTLVADSLADRLGPEHAHHVVLGGTGTWEQLTRLMEARGVPGHLLTVPVSLFRRSRIEPRSQSLEPLPSLAASGDRVELFAEVDLCVVVAGAVRIEVTAPVSAPLPWPEEPAPSPATGSSRGFRVEGGSTFTIALDEGPQIVDVCLLSADDPAEHYATALQLAREGGRIGKGTRLWGNRGRPVATCVVDTVGDRVHDPLLANHICHSDCCSGAFWRAVSGAARRSCYDNLCDGLAQVGLDARAYHGNVNLFMSASLDPESGDLVEGPSVGVRGDRIAFRAEVPLHVALSVCPAGAGGPPDERRGQPTAAVHSVGVEIGAGQ